MHICIVSLFLIMSAPFLVGCSTAVRHAPHKTLELDTWIPDIEIDPARPLAYLSGRDSNSVLIFSFEDLDIVGEVIVGSKPERMDLDPLTDRLYVALGGGPGIAVVNLSAQTLEATWSIESGASDVAVGRPDRLYVTEKGGSSHKTAHIVNTSTGEIVSEITAIGSVYSGAILEMSPDKNYLYLGERGLSPASLYKLDVRTDNVVLVVEDDHGALGSNLRDIVIHPDGETIYVACGAPYHIQAIDTDTITPVGQMDTGAYPSAVAVSQNGSIVLGGKSDHYDPYFYSFNTSTFLKIDEFRTTDEVSRLAISLDGETILAVSGDSYYGEIYLDVYLPSIVDLDPPWIVVTEPSTDEWITSPHITVVWEATDNMSGIASQKIRLDSGYWTTLSADETERDFYWLSDGSHSVTILATDKAGWTAEVMVRFKTDANPPLLQLLSPIGSPRLESGPINVSWMATDDVSGISGYEISVNGEPFTDIGMTTSMSFDDLGEGNHSFRIRAYDEAGNVAECQASASIWPTEPEPPKSETRETFLGFIILVCVLFMALMLETAAILYFLLRYRGRGPGRDW